ncbi:MAG: glycosyltransferase [Syntrophothermus sp.]
MSKEIPQYYRFARPEVQALVPATASRVLDVGCAAGALGAALKARGVKEVMGIEYDPEMAAYAAQHLDRVIAGDVEVLKEDLPFNYFDCIVLADVLEHLREPQKVLERLRKSLAEDGVVVASLPNVGHWSVVRGLLEGRWQYENAGILDRTHLRFFTRKSIIELFNEAGFRIEQLQAVVLQGETVPEGVVQSLKANGIAVDNFKEESAAYQYLVKACPRQPALTSIVILTYNELEYTRQCVESIQKYTHEPYELIFVDNGSSDGTLEYLQNISGARVIANPINLGFGAGCNQGMSVARGEYIVLLNNDTVVTEGWLSRMITRAESDPSVGMVGPRSNYVVGPQMISPVPYGDNLSQMHEFAAKIAVGNSGNSFQILRLVGFCILMKRAVVEKIGGFDERFGQGNFEDDDFCIRANLAGFKLLVCNDVFIHHYGSRTFAGAKMDYLKMMRRNWKKFKDKWDLPVDKPMEAGYRADEVLNRIFDANLHYIPLPKSLDDFSSCLDPVFSEKRGFSFLVMPDWPGGQTALRVVLDVYLSAFKVEDDVSLIVLVEESDEQDLQSTGEWLMEAIKAKGLEVDSVPDILLSRSPDSPRGRLTLYKSVQAYIPAGELRKEMHRKELQACGCQVVEECTPLQLKKAASVQQVRQIAAS